MARREFGGCGTCGESNTILLKAKEEWSFSGEELIINCPVCELWGVYDPKEVSNDGSFKFKCNKECDFVGIVKLENWEVQQ